MYRFVSDRVPIHVDLDWKNDFIPWLEDKEANGIGTEDGVFVAHIDIGLRFNKTNDEGEFLRRCSDCKEGKVSTQHLTEFVQSGVFHYHAHEQSDPNFVYGFKESVRDLPSYKTDTCCTLQLGESHGDLDHLFTHIEQDVMNKKRTTATSDLGLGSSKSIVLAEEAGLKLRRLHKKLERSCGEFRWEKKQAYPAQKCPHMECSYLSSDDEDDNNGEASAPSKTSKKPVQSLEDSLCYGYGFETPSNCLPITQNLRLSRIFNILWLLPHHYPGLHSSYLYLGRTHSFFPVHVEDALSWSINYLHIGHPKLWIVIPPVATDLLEFHLHKSCTFLADTKCYNILGHRCILPMIRWLKERNIPFKIVVQRPGDLVVLYPSAAHFGFNLGPNVAQAIAVATESWIPWAINAKKCNCLLPPIHIDLTPVIAAFRRDLLHDFLNGRVVVTEIMVRAKQLVADEMRKACKDSQPECKKRNEEHQMSTMKCPLQECPKNFPMSPVGSVKKDIIKHIRSSHKPIVSLLLKKVDELF